MLGCEKAASVVMPLQSVPSDKRSRTRDDALSRAPSELNLKLLNAHATKKLCSRANTAFSWEPPPDVCYEIISMLTLAAMARLALTSAFWAEQVATVLCSPTTWACKHSASTACRLGIAECLVQPCELTGEDLAKLLGLSGGNSPAAQRLSDSLAIVNACASGLASVTSSTLRRFSFESELFFGGPTDIASLGVESTENGNDSSSAASPSATKPSGGVNAASDGASFSDAALDRLRHSQRDRLTHVMHALQAVCVRKAPDQTVQFLCEVIGSGVIGLGYSRLLGSSSAGHEEPDGFSDADACIPRVDEGPSCFADVLGAVLARCAGRHEWEGDMGTDLLADLFLALAAAPMPTGRTGPEAWHLYLSTAAAAKTHTFLSAPRRTPLRDLRRRQVAHPATDMRRLVEPLTEAGCLSAADRGDFLLQATCGLLTGSPGLEPLLRAPCTPFDLTMFAAFAVHFYASSHVLSVATTADPSAGTCARLSRHDARQLGQALALSDASVETVEAVLMAVAEAEAAATRMLGRVGRVGEGRSSSSSSGAGSEREWLTPLAFLDAWATAADFPARWRAADRDRLVALLTDEAVAQPYVEAWLSDELVAAHDAPGAPGPAVCELQRPLRPLVLGWARS